MTSKANSSSLGSAGSLVCALMCIVAIAAFMLAPTSAHAAYSLVSGNSQISIDPLSPAGVDGWTVDGINQLAQQWWFFRIGETDQAPVNALGVPTVTQLSANILDIRFTGLYVDVTMRYTLTGGADGSGNSTIAESLRIRNKTASQMAFHLFEYSDLNLNDTPDDDTASLLSSTTVGQWDGAIISTETASAGGMTPVPNHWEIDDAVALLDKLYNAPAVGLSDDVSPFTGDAAFAFQWDMDIAPGATQILSKSKVLMRGGAIGDTVWFDDNADGFQDEDELGIPGVKVDLIADFDNDGTTDYATSTLTDESGYYLFPNLPAGNYTVTVDGSTLPDGAVQTYDLDGIESPNTASIVLATSEVNLNVDFGYRQLASLGDRVWNDLNGDGVQDEGEPGISGVSLNLQDSTGAVIATTATGDDGIYHFLDLPADDYTVTIDESTLPFGFVQTYDLNGELDNSASVELLGGDNRTDVDFGYTQAKPGVCLVKTGPATAKVGDTITYHFKVVNTGNTYLYGGVTVNDPLLGGDIWHKTPVAPGEVNEFDRTYVVGSSNSGGCGATCTRPRPRPRPTPNPCPDVTVLVNKATAIGCPPSGPPVTCSSTWKTTIVKPTCSLGDRVWLDYNANKLQDAGEPGINGVKITLENSRGKVIAKTTTSGDGSYQFANLSADTYKVRIATTTLPSRVSETYELDGSLNSCTTVKLSAGQDRTDVDFGYTGNNPSICLVKTGPETARAGDTITYHFKVVNTGNTYLYGGVTVDDPMLGGQIWHKTPVAPGEVNEFDRSYVVPSTSSERCGLMCTNPIPPCQDKDVLVNTATATGCPPVGRKVTCQSSCSTIIVKSTSCSYATFTQGGWGSTPHGNNPGALLQANFCKVYHNGKVSIGGDNKLTFTSSQAIRYFLPQGGKPWVLKRSDTNPCDSYAGVFAGQVLALKLNVDFSEAGVTCSGLAGVRLSSGDLRGWKIGDVLALAERVLGGDTCALPRGMSVSDLNDVVDYINNLYDN